MKVKVSISNERISYSNDDTIVAQITISDHNTAQNLAQSIRDLDIVLACEGCVNTEDNKTKRIGYYKSPKGHPELIKASKTVLTYRCHLVFPSDTNEYPSSLHFEGTNEGIEWFVRAHVLTENGSAVPARRSCTFMQSGPLPTLLSLVDTEHDEVIEGTHVAVTTTHALAGLPQFPLSAGIGASIKCTKPNAFALKRLRLLLIDFTEVTLEHNHRFLPTHRWLLSDTLLETPMPLKKKTTNLDELTRDVQIDHATLPHTFECKGFTHSFDLAVEVTLVSQYTQRIRKVMSLGTVDVLPRIAHTFITDEHYRTRDPGSEVAYITDSSCGEDEGESNEPIDLYVNPHSGIMERAQSQSSMDSSGSVKSIFSDHMKLELDRGEVAIPTLRFS